MNESCNLFGDISLGTCHHLIMSLLLLDVHQLCLNAQMECFSCGGKINSYIYSTSNIAYGISFDWIVFLLGSWAFINLRASYLYRFCVGERIWPLNRLPAGWLIFWGSFSRHCLHRFWLQPGLPCSPSSSLHWILSCHHSFFSCWACELQILPWFLTVYLSLLLNSLSLHSLNGLRVICM